MDVLPPFWIWQCHVVARRPIRHFSPVKEPLQIIFCSCVHETTLFSFLRSPLLEKWQIATLPKDIYSLKNRLGNRMIKQFFDGFYSWLEYVCWNIGNIRNVKFRFYFFPEKLLYFLMFITAVCFLFLLKLRWPKPTSIYDFKINVLFP